MVDYHRMGNMEGPLGNATPTNSWHQLHWWKSPRWIVIRIEALAVVAIIISFVLVVFGSCRRWSNSWIVQKGFFLAQVLSLSLGTYSIGLMQSSSVKSEMYPVWTVSLFTLFGCIDPVTTYNGLDYKGPLSKVVYGICLNFGYVLLMSISTISNVVGNAAIITLSAITFIKGFHRSFALVQQNRMRDMVYASDSTYGEACIISKNGPRSVRDFFFLTLAVVDHETGISQFDIDMAVRDNNDELLRSCYDVCVALCLSHRLQRYFLGLDYRVPRPGTLKDIDCGWVLKVIEIELAFMYDAFFTGNPFLHYYQAKTASLWALASFTGICFVLVATAIPAAMTRRSGASVSVGCTRVLGTTTADLAITFGILVSLALLQLMQLVRSWTSNWARAAIACAYARKTKAYSTKEAEISEKLPEHLRRTYKMSGWMRLKVFVATSTNLFDKYLWQDKISQYSMLPEPRLMSIRKIKGEQMIPSSETTSPERKGEPKRRRCVELVQMLGLHYIWQVIWELLSSDSNKRGGVKLDEDVKGSVIDFLGQIQSDRLDRNWLSSLPEEPEIRHFLPQYSDQPRLLKPEEHCYRYTSCVMAWHIVTWYCELAEQKKRQEDVLMSKQAEASIGCGRETAATTSYYLRKTAAAIPRPSNCFPRRAGGGGGEGGGGKVRDHRRVANALSMYCVYLVKSAPELLPGPVAWTKRVYDHFVLEAKATRIEACDMATILENMADKIVYKDWYGRSFNLERYGPMEDRIHNGQALAKLLLNKRRPDEIWKTLALVWVQLLVYAAPYGNAEAHMRHLSQGGEFITHLWALLYHLDIRQWKVQPLVEIITTEDAKRILTEDGQAVVAYFHDQHDSEHDEVATASRLEDGVRYYYTSDPRVAKLFRIGRNKLVFLKKEANNQKSTYYEGDYRAYDIARFVTANKIASAHDQAQAQSSEYEGGQSEAGIEEEILPLGLHEILEWAAETQDSEDSS